MKNKKTYSFKKEKKRSFLCLLTYPGWIRKITTACIKLPQYFWSVFYRIRSEYGEINFSKKILLLRRFTEKAYLAKQVPPQYFPITLISLFKMIIKVSEMHLGPNQIYLMQHLAISKISKFRIKTPERRQWRRSSIFIVNFDHISHLFIVFLWLISNLHLFLWKSLPHL